MLASLDQLRTWAVDKNTLACVRAYVLLLWRQITTFSVSVMELYGTLRLGDKFRNFMELFNVSYGTEQLWVQQ